MTHTERITLSPNARTNYKRLSAKQYDLNSLRIVCTLSGFTQSISASDTAKASAYINYKTVDVIACDVDSTSQTISFTLTEACLMQSGLLLIDVSVLSKDTVKLTAGAIAIDVVKSADVNVRDKDYGLSLADKLNSIISLQTFNMVYNSKATILTDADVFALPEDEIASKSPVNISIIRGGGGSTLVRADGVELIDNLTGKVIDNAMNEVEITADDVIAGVKLTEGGTLTVKYYNKKCEGLIAELSKLEIDYTTNKEEVIGELASLSNGISGLQNRYSETSGKNIFHVDAIVEGKFLNYTNGVVNTNADYFYTQNAIDVEPNTTYTGSWYNSDGTFNSVMTAFVLFYNASDEFISGIQLNASTNGTFTIPEGCYYIRYSGKLSTWNSLLLQIEKGNNHSESYEEYYKSTLLKNDYVPIDYIKSECSKRSYIYVDKNGNGDYTTVTEAVANAEDGATIVVAPGNYENETIEAWRKEIHIIGVSKEGCIISNSTATYSTPPIEIGKGSLENLTVIAKYGTGTSTDENGWLPYAVHTEDDNLYNGELTIDNCILVSELNAALGLGMRGGCTVTIKNTQLIGRVGTGNRALYFHDAASSTYAGEQNINIINCQLESDSNTTPTLRIVDQCVDGSNVNLAMVNNLVYNAKGNAYRVGTSNADGGTYDGWRNLKNTTLLAKSFGNNVDAFNS